MNTSIVKMEIIISDSSKAETFTALFQHIKLFTENITLNCDKTHMRMQCMDNAHVAIVELTIPAGWFNFYELTSGRSVQMGFNATVLHRVLSSRDKNQRIHLIYSPEGPDRWMIHLTCGSSDEAPDAETVASDKTQIKPYFDKHFELPLIDIEEDTMQIPEIEYVAELAMQSAQFSGIVTQLKMFGDTMDVQCSEERISLASTSQDQGKMFVEIGINDLTEFAIDEGADLSLSFSLTYLKHICAYSKISNTVAIKFSDSYPMCVSYGLGKEEEEDASLVFYLAPKIND